MYHKEQKSMLQYQYREKNFYFDTSIFTVEDFTDLYGYFQSPLYFTHCLDLIKEEFQFLENIENEASKQISDYSNGMPTCSIHVRRTDYLNSPNYHPTCSVEYYEASKKILLNSTMGNIKFLLFGDDLNWIEDNLLDNNSVIVSGNSGPVDMCLMSKCNAHIIANSSFSW